MRPFGSQQVLERRRLRAMEMIKKGMRPVDVAKYFSVDRRSVRRWKALYRAKGVQALKAKPAPGRPRVTSRAYQLDNREIHVYRKKIFNF